MIRHYLLVAFRNFRRSPFVTVINILTLALGLICFVAAYAIVSYWNHAEMAFPKAGRTYVMTSDLTLRDGSVATGEMARSQDFLAEYLKTEFPELETVARARPGADVSVSVGDRAQRLPVVYADPEFLDVFHLPFIAGSAGDALDQPESVVLTESGAMRMFGSTDIVGERLQVGETEAVVGGVISEVPQPSHLGAREGSALRFELLVTYRLYERFMERFQAAQRQQMQARGRAAEGQASDGAQGNGDGAAQGQAQGETPDEPPEIRNWLGGYCCMTYLVLPQDGSLTAERLMARLPSLVERHVPENQRSIAEVKLGAVPVTELVVTNLNSVLFARTAPGLSVTVVLLLLGGLVLAVAGLNYANIATARATGRAREVGMRKAVGAARHQVMFQYVMEAGLLTTAALVVAMAVLQLVRRPLMNTADVDIALVYGSGPGFWLFLAGLIVAVSLLAGAYPAFILSRVRPMDALRLGKVRTGPRFVPSLLVGAQFAAASFLMIAVIVMYMQNSDLRRTGLGSQEDPTLVITNISQFTGIEPELLRAELERIPQVKDVSGSSRMPWSMDVGLTILSRTPEESAKQISAMQIPVDYNYFKTMEVRLLAGRVFDHEHGGDLPPQGLPGQADSRPVNIVAEEAFVRQVGYGSATEAVDKLVYMPERLTKAFGGTAPQPMRIIGVVETKAQAFLGLGATAAVYQLNDIPMYVLARVDRSDVAAGRSAIEAVWKRLAPKQPIIMQFSDSLFEQNYKTFGTINSTFAGLAIFALVISAIGLFGIAIQVTSRRLTEIGVRKAIGASTRQILTMLLRDFSKPVLIANLVAWPLGFVAAQIYLSVFMHRISLTFVPFLLSMVLTLVIAWLAVGAMAWKAARANPARVLKYE